MHYNSLIKSILERCEFQLIQSVRGLSTSLFNEKLTFETRSVYDTLVHLIDVCYSYQYLRKHEKYQWQSFTSQDVSKEASLSFFLEVWKTTCALACQISTEEEFLDVIDYLVLHTSYHVGQICALRMKIDTQWDAKSIYRYNKR